MHILIGPMKAENEEQIRHPERRLEDSFCFYEKDSGSYEEILAMLPEGWKPDVVIHWSLEYYIPPKGIEKADCLTVGIFGDWNLGAYAVQNIGSAFDILFADRAGCELLQNLGFNNAYYARLWGFDSKLHRRLPEIERDIDILMMGNLNHIVQRERSFWLARVAKLSRRHNVLLTTGVYGEDYTRMMNRAKIVFNRSVGGGINMRAYETMACGALLFNERENLEIRDIFTDREHCVLYGDDDLEILLDYYLATENTAERKRIASAGWKRVQNYRDFDRISELLDKIENILAQWKATNRKREPRGFEKVQLINRELCRLHHAHLCNEGGLYATLNQEMSDLLKRLVNLPEYLPQAANAHAALLGEWGVRLPQEDQPAAFKLAEKLLFCALKIEPNYFAAQWNLGYLYHAFGKAEEGNSELLKALDILNSPTFDPSQLRGVLFPHRFERFDLEAQCIWGRYAAGTREWSDEMRRICKGKIYFTRAQSAYIHGEFSESVHFANEAVFAISDWGEAHYLLACSHRELGNNQDAHNAFKRAISACPFMFDAWKEDAQLLMDLGRAGEAATILDELLAILNGCPFYAYVLPEIETKLFQAKLKATRQAAKTPVRMLALPNWNEPKSWQPLVRKYVEQYHHGDPVSLMLPVVALQHPKPETVLKSLIEFVDNDLHILMEDIADVVLMTEPLNTVLNIDGSVLADILVLMNDCNELEIAQNADIPTITLENLDQALTLVPTSA